MTLTASSEDAEDSEARSSGASVTSPTHDRWNPHRHEPTCWWDHRDARWICPRPEVHLPAPAQPQDE